MEGRAEGVPAGSDSSGLGLDTLPLEVVERLVGLLDDDDLVHCTEVSASWWAALNANSIWKPRCGHCYWTDEALPPYSSQHEDDKRAGEGACEWRLVFDFHRKLTDGWGERKWRGRYTMATGGDALPAPVFCLDSDGSTTATGHQDGTLNLWCNEEACGPPRLKASVRCLLEGLPVLSVRVVSGGCRAVAVQKKLLQVYGHGPAGAGGSGDAAASRLHLVHALSLDMGANDVQMMENVRVLGPRFHSWYMECLRYNQCYSSKRLLFAEAGGRMYATASGSGELHAWGSPDLADGEDGARHSTAEVCAKDEQVRHLQKVPDQHRTTESDPAAVYVVVAGGVDCLSVVVVDSGWPCRPPRAVLSAPPSTRKLLLEGGYWVGLPARGVQEVATLRVWHKATGRPRGTGEHLHLARRHLSTGHVTACVLPATGHVVYTEDAWVTVWHPVSDLVLQRFSTGGCVGFIKHGYSRFGLMFINCCLYVWDLVEGRRLYMLYSGLEWTGDFRSLVWSDGRILVIGGVNNQTDMIVFA